MRYLSTLNRGQDSPATVSDYEAIILLIAIEREGRLRKDFKHQSPALDAIVWVSPRGISIWRAGKSWAHIQAMGTPSRERKSNQYWSLIEVVRVSNIYQYWLKLHLQEHLTINILTHHLTINFTASPESGFIAPRERIVEDTASTGAIS